jgi:hypothetical protein
MNGNGNKINIIEVWFGGITAALAAIAIILLCLRDGFSIDSILNGLINFAQISVAAMVLLVAVRTIFQTKKPKETFRQVLSDELGMWVARNRPLISLDKDFKTGVRFFMLTDHEHIFDVGECLTDENTYKKGQFVVLPEAFISGVEPITFHLNKSTFSERAKAKGKDTDDEIKLLAARIATCINAHFAETFSASADDKYNRINVIFLPDQEWETPDKARLLVKLIENVMTLYMVAS